MMNGGRQGAFLFPVALCLLIVFAACPAKEDPGQIFLQAEALFSARNYTEAAVLYHKVLALDPEYQSDTVLERIKACDDKLAVQAARKLGKDAEAKVPKPPSPPPLPSVTPVAASSGPSVPSSGGVTKCDPAWRGKIEPLDRERAPLEVKIADMGQQTGAIESKYGVSVRTTATGFDFTLPAGTAPEKVQEFQSGPARDYTRMKAEMGSAQKKLEEIRAKIAAVEKDAADAHVLRECLYPLK